MANRLRAGMESYESSTNSWVALEIGSPAFFMLTVQSNVSELDTQ